jgi:predicted small lipoprotein YifL
MKIVHLWVALCLAGLLVGCGQKGPLVLPDAPKPHKRLLSSPKPASQPPAAKPDPAAPSPGGPGAGAPPEAAGNPSNASVTP